MRKGLSGTNDPKAILLVCDDNFMRGLVATINSIIRNFPNAKIYLVHELSKKNLGALKPFLYKYERFDDSLWKHLDFQAKPFATTSNHVSQMHQGRYQVEFIEEDYYLYLDSDAIINRRFSFERPATLSCQILKRHLVPYVPIDVPLVSGLKSLREFVLKEGGIIEKGEKISLYLDGGFFANKQWILDVFRPKLREVTIQYASAPKFFGSMDYFNAAVDLLKRPVTHWKITQFLPPKDLLAGFDMDYSPRKRMRTCEIVHFLAGKPWSAPGGRYPYEGGDLWKFYYLNGPAKAPS